MRERQGRRRRGRRRYEEGGRAGVESRKDGVSCVGKYGHDDWGRGGIGGSGGGGCSAIGGIGRGGSGSGGSGRVCFGGGALTLDYKGRVGGLR